MTEPTAVQRARELAATSDARTIEDIRRALRNEGFDGADDQLTSHNLKKQLRAAINERILKEVA